MLSLCVVYIYMCMGSEDDFEIKSKIYSLNLRLVLNHILYSQDVLSFRNLFFTLLLNCRSWFFNIRNIFVYFRFEEICPESHRERPRIFR
jgi:hypothetical protein